MECSGFKGEDGQIEMIENIREHPVLKHIPKFQTSMLALADALELTPKARSKKSTDETASRREDRVEQWLMEAQKKRMAANDATPTTQLSEQGLDKSTED